MHRDCASVQQHRPSVVAETGPGGDRLARRGGGQRLDRRPALQPRLPARQHPRDLGLLQHDFRNQDGIRITRPPPREVASVFPIPGQHQLSHLAQATLASPLCGRVAEELEQRTGVPFEEGGADA